jgi:hypothetical protein
MRKRFTGSSGKQSVRKAALGRRSDVAAFWLYKTEHFLPKLRPLPSSAAHVRDLFAR